MGTQARVKNALTVFLGLFAIASVAQATTYLADSPGVNGCSTTVPRDLRYTLLYCVSAGDQVEIVPGAHTTTSQISVYDEVTIYGTGGASLTCTMPGQCLYFRSGSGSAELRNLRLSSPAGIAVLIDGASPHIHHVAFLASNVGIDPNPSTSAVTSAPSIEHNLFFANVYGFLGFYDDTVVVSQSLFGVNTSAGLLISREATTEIRENRFWRNSVGVWINQGDNASLVHRNYMAENDWAIYALDSGMGNNADRISSNQIRDSVYYGTLLSASGGGDTRVVDANTYVTDDTAIFIDTGGITTLAQDELDDPTLTATQVTNNLVNDPGTDGIVSNASQPKISYNTIVYAGSDAVRSQAGDQAFAADNIAFASWGAGFNALGSANMRLGYNDAFGNTADYNGLYVDLGNNLTVAPLFAGGSFELQAGSPLISAAGLDELATDHDGNPRDPLPNSEIGAFEY